MVNEKPNVRAAGRYSTNETCALLGIGRSTLSRWTKAGIIRVNYRRCNMRPYYTGLDIVSAWNLNA